MRHFIYRILGPLNHLYGKMQPSEAIRVLAYHTVPDSKKFEEQINYLCNAYSIIDMNELSSYINEGKGLPPNPLLITFDDGDITVLEKGLPILQKYFLPAVLFVITELINSSKTFWCRWVEQDFIRQGKSYSDAREVVNKLKKVPEKERKDFLKTLLNFESRQLTTKDLKTLKENSIFIANHTHTHPMVNMCSEEELIKELKHSRECFNSWNLEGFDVFAYPNGNWDLQSENILKKEGIKLAFIFDHRINKDNLNPLRISRIKVDSDCDLNEFKIKVSGLHPQVMELREKLKL